MNSQSPPRDGGRCPPAQRLSFVPGLPVPFGIEPVAGPVEPCPYRAGREAVTRAFRCDRMPGAAYQTLMDAGFRRSGSVFYQPVCPGCRACRALRVPVNRFRPGKSLRRVWRRNRDLALHIGPPELTTEKVELYARYLAVRHEGSMTGSKEELAEFLYRSPTESAEFCYRDAEARLLAVGLCDVTPRALSSVYFYFTPEEAKRSLGTFGSLVEIQTARTMGLAFYYPGFWVADSPKMAYKQRLRPCEVLGTDARWRMLRETTDLG